MKRIWISLLLLAFAAAATTTAATPGNNTDNEKRYALYGVAFYNLENLFDTVHDYGKRDYEFLPNGTMNWGKMKYEAKLHNMAKVLSLLCTDKLRQGPAVIGVSEVENRRVLEDLTAQPALRDRGLEIVHYDGPDRRGVDCAFLYNPRMFKLESSMLVPYYYLYKDRPDEELLGFTTDADGRVTARTELLGDTTYITRGFLVMSGRLAGEKMHFIVNHWPSRAAGSEARERAGHQVRLLKDALLRQDPGAKVVIMGDMNDDPDNKSMTTALGCKRRTQDVKTDGDLYNPWYDMLYKTGQGTLRYNGKWNLFDQIVFTGNLLGNDRSTLKFYRNEIFMRDWLFQQEGRYKGNPLRTHAGGAWLNGYSDHLPTMIYLVKEVE